MTENDALTAAKMAARFRQLKFGRHAKDRMKERNLSPGDVENAVLTASLAVRCRDNPDRFEIDGVDFEGEKVRVVVTIPWETVVVTVYGL